MLDKHMLYKIANSIQTKWVKGKHVIELYPGFGLLSLRLMKKGNGERINSFNNEKTVVAKIPINVFNWSYCLKILEIATVSLLQSYLIPVL